MTPLETLSFTLDLIANIVSVFGIPFAVWRLYTNWQEDKRRQQLISVELFGNETDTVIQLPVSVKRDNFTRAELLGYLSMISKSPKNRYDLAYLSEQAFFEELQRIQNGRQPETLRIPCTAHEIAQFKGGGDWLPPANTKPASPPTAVAPFLLNFTHPLTADQLGQIVDLIGQPINDHRHIPLQLDNGRSFPNQIRELLNNLNLTPEQWQTAPILINPPAYAPATATLMAELHGRMGYFPAAIRLRPIPDSSPTQYEVAEIVNLQTVRDGARQQR